MRGLLLSLGLSLTGAGCGLSCTEVGCTGSLEVTFTNVTLEDGAYRVEADLSGGTEAVSFDVEGGVALPPEDGWVSVEIVGADLVATFGTGMDETASSVAVRLLDADDAVLVEGEVSPDWSDPDYPNGKACGGGCVSGSAAL